MIPAQAAQPRELECKPRASGDDPVNPKSELGRFV